MALLKKIADRIRLFSKQFYRVPYCVPAWGWAEHWIVLKCLVTRKMIDGPDRGKLYCTMREKTGVKYIFGFDSGSEAIQAALTACGIGQGDGVVMPSYCCESVASAIKKIDASPVFCDIGEDLNPDVDHVVSLLDASVKAIVFPHLFGNPAAINKLEDVLTEKGLREQILLIDDAAQSFGARLNGKLLGTFGDVGIVSFGPGKTMTAFGGGLLLTNSEEIAASLRMMPVKRVDARRKFRHILYWLIFRRWRRFTLPFYPFVQKIFQNDAAQDGLASLFNIDAAIANEQMGKLEQFLARRMERKQRLDALLSAYPEKLFSLTPKNDADGKTINVATKYVVGVTNSACHDNIQDQYSKSSKDAGIEIMDLYFPIHMKPDYSGINRDLPVTEKLYRRIMHIPLEPSMDEMDFVHVKDHFVDFIQAHQ